MHAHGPHPSSLVAGEWVGAWRIVARLGSGTFGAVYKVECEGELFALKFSLRRAESDDLNQTDARLRKEMVCLSQVQHPNVVRIHALGRWPHPTRGYLYLLMDYVEGAMLMDWVRRVEPTFGQVLVLFDKLALALDALDRKGVRHRDLKGANILVRDRDAEPILLDFGSADHELGADLTEGPLPPGTPHYRSPESIRFLRRNYRDPQARYVFRSTDDVYALGVAFYEALAGRPPFRPDTPREILNAEIEAKVPLPPAYYDERIPPAVNALAMRLLEKRPEDRPQSGWALHEELQAVLRAGGPSLHERVLVRSPDLITTK